MPNPVLVIDLDAPDPPSGETPKRARCRCCRRPLSDETSLGYEIGPDCRKRLGIAPRARVRLARTKPGGDCPGQGDLTELLEQRDQRETMNEDPAPPT